MLEICLKCQKKRERKRERVRERQFNFVQIMLTSGFFSVLQCPSLNITLILLIWQRLSFSLFKKKNWNNDNNYLFLLFIFRGGLVWGVFFFFFGKSSLGCGLLNLNIYEWCIFKYSEQDTILSAVKSIYIL